MSRENKIALNVYAFLDKAAVLHAASEESKFQTEMYSNLHDLGMESPIEHMFWIACHAQCAAQYHELNPEPYVDKHGQPQVGAGIHIRPQAQIGKFRVDFLISQVGIGPDDILSPVIVELDGHAFHDKDKRQRSYEKARDRYLVREGFRVLHFTGSDVVADPFKVSHEVLDLLGAFLDVGHDYDPENPLKVA